MKAPDSSPTADPVSRAPGHEGEAARRWREEVARLDPQALARRLGLGEDAVRRMEAEARVPTEYRLACAALAAGLDDWQWQAVRPRANQDRGKAEQAALLLVRALAHFDRDPHLVRDLLDQASRAIAEARIRSGAQDDGFA